MDNYDFVWNCMETMFLYGLKWFCMDFWILHEYYLVPFIGFS